MLKELRKGTVAALAGLGVPVHDSKVTPETLKTLPCVMVYSESANGDNRAMLGLGAVQNSTIQLDVLTAMTAATYADTLDDLIETVIVTLFNDTTYQALWEHIESYQIQYDYQNSAQQPLAFATITISGVTFRNDQ